MAPTKGVQRPSGTKLQLVVLKKNKSVGYQVFKCLEYNFRVEVIRVCVLDPAAGLSNLLHDSAYLPSQPIKLRWTTSRLKLFSFH